MRKTLETITAGLPVMKKNIFSLLLLLSCSYLAPAQKLMKTVYVNKGAVTSNPKEAEWLIAIRNVDGRYERNDYTMNGPLKRVKTFKDLNQTVLEGNYIEYDNNGNIQVAGFYTNNKKSGKWFYYNDSGNVIRTERFEGNGIYEEKGNYYFHKDSLTLPSFKAGKNEWRNYLHENLNWDQVPNQLKDEEVKISFAVTESGALKNFVLIKSEYFTADNEIIRALSASPKWKPALYNGRPEAYRCILNFSLYDLFHEN